MDIKNYFYEEDGSKLWLCMNHMLLNICKKDIVVGFKMINYPISMSSDTLLSLLVSTLCKFFYSFCRSSCKDL